MATPANDQTSEFVIKIQLLKLLWVSLCVRDIVTIYVV